jgi:hypothetical protein
MWYAQPVFWPLISVLPLKGRFMVVKRRGNCGIKIPFDGIFFMKASL